MVFSKSSRVIFLAILFFCVTISLSFLPNKTYAIGSSVGSTETKTLSSKGTKVTFSGLVVGATYNIVVSGTVKFNSDSSSDPFDADAQWIAHNKSGKYTDHNNSISINGSQTTSSDFTASASPNHTYKWIHKATTTSLVMYVVDSNYSDNTGSLTAKVTLTSLTGGNPSGTALALDLLLHGIGKAGDSVKPGAAGGGNIDPNNKERDVRVNVFNGQNQNVKSITTKVTFDSTSGSFKGFADLGNSFPTGSYLVKVKFSQSLDTQIGNLHTITNLATTNLPQTSFVTGDINDDGAISLNVLDYTILLDCLSGASCDETQKIQADLDDNGKVDVFDFNLFIREIANPTS